MQLALVSPIYTGRRRQVEQPSQSSPLRATGARHVSFTANPPRDTHTHTHILQEPNPFLNSAGNAIHPVSASILLTTGSGWLAVDTRLETVQRERFHQPQTATATLETTRLHIHY